MKLIMGIHPTSVCLDLFLLSDLVLHSHLEFSKPEDASGRFLGIASNVGDRFCYLILTLPTNGASPQDSARSFVRHQYPRELPPVVDDSSEELIFYCNDGVTPLPDPTSVPVTDDISDVHANAIDLLSQLSANQPGETWEGWLTRPLDISEEFEDGIQEVYGPPTKRLRVGPDAPNSLPSPSTATSLQAATSPEEQPLPAATVLVPSISQHAPDIEIEPSPAPINTDPVLPDICNSGTAAGIPSVAQDKEDLADQSIDTDESFWRQPWINSIGEHPPTVNSRRNTLLSVITTCAKLWRPRFWTYIGVIQPSKPKAI